METPVDAIDSERRRIQEELMKLKLNKEQDTSRIDKEIKSLEKMLEDLKAQTQKETFEGLDPIVTNQLDAFCNRINTDLEHRCDGFAYEILPFLYMEIIRALQVCRTTTHAKVQHNIRAIAEVMCQKINFRGYTDARMISCESTDNGIFNIMLRLENGETHLRIYSYISVNDHRIRIALIKP
jgi:hypothetical protein